MNFFKLSILLILLFTIIMFSNASAEELVPKKPEFFHFRMIHIVKDISQEESFEVIEENDRLYNITSFKGLKNGRIRRFYSRKVVADTSWIINQLNYIDFLHIKDKIAYKSKKKKTITKFILSYKYKGKKHFKKIIIEDIDTMIENPKNEAAFRLMYLLTTIESYEKAAYESEMRRYR